MRSASQKLAILAYADKHGSGAAIEKYGVSYGLIGQWREKLPALQAAAKQEPDRVHVEVPLFMGGKPPSQPPAEPSTPRQAITGLGPLIAEVRTAVIEELCERLGGIIGGMVDERMPEIVSRELRKLLTEGNEQKEPAKLRAVKSA